MLKGLFSRLSPLISYLILTSLFSFPKPAHAEPELFGRTNISSASRSGIVERSNESGQFKVKSSLLKNDEFYWELLSSINKAEKEISASMFLFKTSLSRSGRADKLLDALTGASERGVKVSFFLEQSGEKRDSVGAANRESAERLIKSGIGVYFDSLKRTTHTKVIVIDRKTVFMGSHNLTNSALQYNNELSVKIESAKFAEDVLSYLKDLE